MKKIIALLVVASTFFVSCDDIDTANVSSITNYPLITVIGSNPIFVPLGGTYTDPGAVATENGAPIAFTSVGSGNYRKATTIDTNIADEYSQTYTASNKDGFKASAVRKVIVYKTGDLVNSIEGVYTCTISRNGVTPSNAYRNIKYIYIWKNTDGSYEISDSFGGWYQYGRGLGLSYITPGAKIIANNIATNDFSFPGTQSNLGFGGSSDITSLTVNATTKTLVLTTSWDAGPYIFVGTLTQVQL
ncbi:immunoglobulin-like domain-containing protein [Flavobacterium sp. XS2P39]|uniref:immunoglobulin-like domain-containing protein n=1 Tax=Flavobacterium sp. XS2P39 TaxID=3401725 RepID=UPI003AAD93A5